MVKENTMKQTEIGLIPEEWEIKSVAELINENSIISHLDGNHGALYPKSNEFIEDGVAYVGANALINNKIDYGKAKYLSAKRADTFIKGVAKAGDVLFAHNATVGPVGLVDNSYDKIILSTTLTYYRTDNSKLLNKYLLYEFQTDRFIRQYSSVMSQSTRNQVPISPQRKFVVCVPPLPEQEAIAEVLSDADAWIERLEQLIAKKRLIKQGAMQELLSPKENWEERKLGELGEVKMCKRIFQYQTSEFGEIPFYKIGTFGKIPDAFISRNNYQEFKNKFSFPKKGEILISAAGTIGRTVVYDGEECYFQDSNIVWINNQEEIVSNKFLKYILEVVKYNTEGGTIQRLYNSILRDTTFHCPSLTEQTRIATILADMDAELEALEGQLDKARKVKQGMMQELLTGKKRLV
ncbi:restriction endonuclease subunit S [Chryseobacterium sp. NKUCC03_KSP]|uniref:restriction endonuclease subunit S n=1 Tax=Chryseobacterium sp. NKUCC03_KSP TaxID=2842125 RepID=UPI001C5BE098|nr:restriction endonuclease subunit S [Chryseobacterium sp. NKUCC03_KSP]MBW3521841.1 restriction endonuclease subunit S [Chryseobacterium sp. NKUCC03_KSP]